MDSQPKTSPEASGAVHEPPVSTVATESPAAIPQPVSAPSATDTPPVPEAVAASVIEPPKDTLDTVAAGQSVQASSVGEPLADKKPALAIIVAVVCFVALCAVAYFAYTKSS
jgi:hypothetical protein